ncbi:xanthine dehydrogenase family protein molybdopterin-binding subunit [Algoriphagus aquimarinus]|uniref:Xanthine dehydrogenase family protein molybdopterin-binding subunit n=1 Tax=Algoriphagus aquimarinus TaxID=237018 RepID=A0A5C7AUQ2_9BACT|nr:molybdopterin cofactor-binding domain-containing protein [Algoriphagus aquimarinus]TXE10235.1 xanthine dehydrogenase family protein molybdopterin-binding subunit [Algoriphagus aquimarinus]
MIELSKTSRRKFLRDIGYISVGFPLLSSCFGEQDPVVAARVNYEGDLPGSMRNASKVNAWLHVLEDGRVMVFSGKVELGQGIRTAIRQVAAEELDLELDQVEVHLAETGVTPDEGYTAGSSSVPNSAMSVRYAAATARQKLLELASAKLNIAEEDLILYNGKVKSKKSNQSLNFAEILEGAQIDMEVTKPVPLKIKSGYRYVGKAIPRKDIEKMVRGEEVYIQDLRFPGMVHARVLRPAGYQSKLVKVDDSGLSTAISGIIKTVVNGSFVGVITDREYQAVKAEAYLRKHSEWTPSPSFPKQETLFAHLKSIAEKPQSIRNEGDITTTPNGTDTFKASYTKPYLKHGSIGPACGIAMYDGEILHIWSHSQGIYPMRRAIAAMLKMEQEKLHVIAVPGAGCFGHSTADDAATDAAILALSYPGKHIRVQWSRHDEHTWDPYGTAMIMELEASLDANGKIKTWKTDVWTDSHSMRPDNDPATLLDTRYLENPVQLKGRGYLGGGHRNADPYYSIPNMQVNAHFFNGPLRVSSLRSLGSYTTIFSIESFMDELAEKAGKDPLEFRLAHLEDARAIAVINKIQEMCNGEKLEEGEGIGYAFSRYKNTTAYATAAAKVSVDRASGTIKLLKMWAAVDVGEIINLDGIINQIEGGMLQAASWTLKEEVTFEDNKITSSDWRKYPVFRFSDIPEVEVAMIDRPNEAAEGGGEVSMPPTGAAIANAVYNACGKRVYDLPITAEKILG